MTEKLCFFLNILVAPFQNGDLNQEKAVQIDAGETLLPNIDNNKYEDDSKGKFKRINNFLCH